jgi:transcription-repair coupling factor (superfamily II helicase)
MRERPGLVLLENYNDAEELTDDLLQLLGPERVFLLPARELLPYDAKRMPLEKRSELEEILRRLRLGDSLLLVAGIRQLALRYPRPEHIDRGLFHLEPGMELDREEFIARLDAAGFRRESAVEDIAQYSLRGGILDIYPWGQDTPVRLEFFGDEIESIRSFDPATQVSIEELSALSLMIAPGQDTAWQVSLFELLRPDTLILAPPTEIIRERVAWVEEEARRAWPNIGDRSELSPPEDRYLGTAAVLAALQDFQRIVLHPSRRIDDGAVNFRTRRQESFLRNIQLLANNLRALHQESYRCHILCDNHGQLERLREILDEFELAPSLAPLSVGSLHGGFLNQETRQALFTDHEIFGRPRIRRHVRRFKRATAIRRIENLEPGDAVVHIRYGVGIFEGLSTISVDGHEREVLKLRYSDNDRVYVRLENFRDVEKYSAAEGAEPRLSKLGSGDWDRAKAKTKKSIQKIAGQLVELYARRRTSRGHAFGQDTVWQREMEAAFEFEETSDQLSAIEAVKADMVAPWPMDRLICGDVGFGKTEVAVRAVFKAVADGMQAAVLVPTTILAQQHYNTFTSRYAEFPVEVEVLSRFRSSAETGMVLSRLQEGQVDVVIGTHRLLSKDVRFKNLGLLVVDEEQRFGVMHKERIKQLKANLDVITMTATPIPRTLDMALLGIRDLSLVNVPPSNRLPIETEITPFNQHTIRSAILRELDRNGQVYFVHNRVQTIEAMAAMLRDLVPEARFRIGHGQMKEHELESVMLGFMRREFDVLVSTMIIETGLDIPNVNTMLVNRADTFGLAQLYQLRGRIGRSHRQAYAYLLTPPAFEMKPDAKKRLHTIGEFTDLGSGFKIAMRDLEIRGSGNILGAEQSGHIATVGYELYNRLLEEAILELKADPDEEPATVVECRVELPVDALLPGNFVEDAGERVNLYRRLQQASTAQEVLALQGEVADRFGSLPREARMLFALVELQTLGRSAGLELVDLRGEGLSLRPAPQQEGSLLARLGSLGGHWPLSVKSEPRLVLRLEQRGTDWLLRLDQTRRLLRALCPAPDPQTGNATLDPSQATHH